MDDEVPGLAAGAGLADVVELEERRAGDQALAPQPGEQRHAPLGRDQAGVRPGGEDRAGQVDQLAVLPPGPGGDHHGPAGRSSALQPARIWVNPASRSSMPWLARLAGSSL